MRRLLRVRLIWVPLISAAVVAGTIASGVVGAGAAPSPVPNVPKTTIAMNPTVAPPTAAAPTAAVPPPSTVPPLTAATVTASVVTIPPPTAVGVPTTDATGLSPESVAAALPLFGLDAAKLQCLVTALPPFGTDDATALAALQGCGVALMPLLRGIANLSQNSTVFLDPTATTVPLPTVPGAGALAPEDAFYIGFLLLLLPEEAQCLADGLALAPGEDDATALAIMQGCTVPLGRTLDMLMLALESDAASVPTAPPSSAITAPPTTVATGSTLAPGAPTTIGSISPDDPVVDIFQEELLAEEGITLDDQQAACLLSQIDAGAIDLDATDDLATVFTALEACGITLTDLIPAELSANRRWRG